MPDFIYLTPKCCINCQEKQDSTCKHDEDVCQHCLEKVQTTTEKEDSPPGALSHLNKKVLIFINSSTIVASGVLWYFSTKKLFNIANKAVNSIFETIVAPIYKG